MQYPINQRPYHSGSDIAADDDYQGSGSLSGEIGSIAGRLNQSVNSRSPFVVHIFLVPVYYLRIAAYLWTVSSRSNRIDETPGRIHRLFPSA